MSDENERTAFGITEADFVEAARRLAEVRPPCGATKRNPHIVSPRLKSGDVGHCVRCGAVGTIR